MDPSSLSLALLALRESLCQATALKTTQVTIGTPAQAHQQQQDAPDQTLLNLFVYQVLPEGWPADAAAGGTSYWRLRCLITPMAGKPGADTPGSGDTDLRLLGAVAAALQAHPGLDVVHDETTLARVQVVPMQLSLDELNPLWSTQAGVPYRASLACELGLLPVPLHAAQPGAARVVAVGLRVWPDVHAPAKPGADTPVSLWRPLADQVPPPQGAGNGLQLYWLDDAGRACYATSLPAAAAGPSAQLIALGPDGARLTLHWQLWQPQTAWRDEAGPGPLAVSGQALPPDADPQALAALAQPLRVPLAGPGQALLRATALLATPAGPQPLSSNALLLALV